MYKFLSLAFAVLFFAASFKSYGQNIRINSGAIQDDFKAKKKGTLSVQTSSGGGADDGGAGCWTYIREQKKYLCLNDNAGILLRDSSSDQANQGSLTWSYNGQFYSNDSEITVTRPGIYRLDGGDIECWDEVLITSTRPVAVPPNTTICPLSSMSLNAATADALSAASSLDTLPIISYQWYKGTALLHGANDSVYAVSKTGNYYVKTTDANGCVQNSDVININLYNPPSTLLISGDSCANGKLLIDNSSTNLIPDQITWYRNDTIINTFNNAGVVVAGDNGSGNGLNQLNQPYGIFLDSHKNIYIADHDNDRIVKWAPNASSGVVVADTLFHFNGAFPNDVWVDSKQNISVSTDIGVTVKHPFPYQLFQKSVNNTNAPITGDADSNLYICNIDSVGFFTIEKWNSYTGYDAVIADNPNQPLVYPGGIFADSHNNLFVADQDPVSFFGRVLKFAPGEDSGAVVAGNNGSIGQPGGLTVDKAGNMYVEDIYNDNVQLWKPGATNGIIIANGFHPGGIVIDNDGNLYIANATFDYVYKYLATDISSLNFVAPGNIAATVAAGGNGEGSDLNQLNTPSGIFVDSAKNLYVSDYGNDRIVKWTPNASSGQLIINNVSFYDGDDGDLGGDIWMDKNQHLFISDDKHIIHIPLPSLLDHTDSWGITGDADSNLYISENGGIEKWNSYTNADSLFGANKVNEPNGIFIDSHKNIYIGDNLTDSEFNYYGRILKFEPKKAGTVATAGRSYTKTGAVGGIAVDKAGNIFVADINNNQVQLWKPGSSVPEIIASGYTPWGIKLDNDGNIYVADQTNNRVIRYPAMIENSVSNTAAGVYRAKILYQPGCLVNADGMTNTNLFTVNNCTSSTRTLPLQLLNFTGQLQKTDVLLNWQTAQEINTGYFNIQRSADAFHFAAIGKTMTYGNSNNINNYNYNYTDADVINATTNKLYYRLKEVDKDGSFIYSKIITINLNQRGWNYIINPNPVHDLLSINLKNISGLTGITVLNVNGQHLAEQNISGYGNKTVKFNTTALAAGIYFIQVISNGTTQQQKFIKL